MTTLDFLLFVRAAPSLLALASSSCALPAPFSLCSPRHPRHHLTPCACTSRTAHVWQSAEKFNQSLESWDTSSVTCLRGTFRVFAQRWPCSHRFLQWPTLRACCGRPSRGTSPPISRRCTCDTVASPASLDVSATCTLRQLACNFDQDIDSWDISSATTLERMFDVRESR